MIHQIGKNIHGLIHDMEATHESDFVESFNALLERVCRGIFSIIDYASKSEYSCRKKNSYDDLEGASPHVLFLQHIDEIDKPMHSLSIIPLGLLPQFSILLLQQHLFLMILTYENPILINPSKVLGGGKTQPIDI